VGLLWLWVASCQVFTSCIPTSKEGHWLVCTRRGVMHLGTLSHSTCDTGECAFFSLIVHGVTPYTAQGDGARATEPEQLLMS
jgi:hypothetical protein